MITKDTRVLKELKRYFSKEYFEWDQDISFWKEMDDKIILATYDALAQAHSFNIYSNWSLIILCIHMPPDRK